jgi:hypothetical protein
MARTKTPRMAMQQQAGRLHEFTSQIALMPEVKKNSASVD